MRQQARPAHDREAASSKARTAVRVWNDITPSSATLAHTIIVDPVNTSTVYAVLDFDIVKTTDAGSTWTVVLRGADAVAIDPSNPSTLYAAMPEAFSISHKLYKSINRGDEWTLVGSFISEDIPVLSVHPSNPATLYAKSERLLKSVDQGVTWNAIDAGLTEVGIISMPVVDPVDPATLYVGTGRGVFKSTDAGVTWQPTRSN